MAWELVKGLMRFTLSTGGGINVGVDFAFEKYYVNLVRETTGKTWNYGHEAKVEHAALCQVQHHN